MNPNSPLSDKELIVLLNNKDEKVLALIYDKYWETMYIAAYNMIPNKSICEDIIQDIFISLWVKRDNIYIKSSLKSFLYTCTINKVYSYFRKNNKYITEELLNNFNNKTLNTNPENKLIHEELMQHIESVIDELPPKCKKIFKLSREKQLSNKKIAEKLNISQRTVEGHISKALKLLRESIDFSIGIFIFFQVL